MCYGRIFMNKKQISLISGCLILFFASLLFCILKYRKSDNAISTLETINSQEQNHINQNNEFGIDSIKFHRNIYLNKFPIVEDDNAEHSFLTTDQISNRINKEIVCYNLSKRLTNINDYFVSTGSNKTIHEFIDWLCITYGTKNIIQISSRDNLNSDLYQLTGKSLFVLSDEFLGIHQSIDREATNKEYVNLMFAGDICLAEDGFVLDYYDTAQNLNECIDSNIIEKTNTADIFMLNNEFCYSTRGNALSGKMYTFRANPERVQILQQLGTDIASLANNHVYDFGPEAFQDTMETLKNQNIQYVGGGNNIEEAKRPVYFVINGMKIGYISSSMAEKVRYTKEATETDPGIFRMYDYEPLKEVVKNMSNQCDYVIAYLHWGTEDSKYYEEYQHNIAADLIESGADAIIGGHPHVLQGIEYIEGKPVVYSLGDFWFNDETKYTGMVNLQININGLKSMDVIPCLQSDYKTTMISENEEKAKFFNYLNELSNGCFINENGTIIW